MHWLMKKFFIVWTCWMAWLCPSLSLRAQVRIEHAAQVQGKLTRHRQVAAFLRGFKAMPEARSASLAATADKALDVLCSPQQVRVPRGFDVDAGVSADGIGLKADAPFLRVVASFRYLEKRSGVVKTSLDGADLFLEINALHGFFDQVGNFWKDCYQTHFPLFFEEVPVTDSTADYLEINFRQYGFPYVSNNLKDSPIRIIRANDKPLWVPLTRKEYMQFLVARYGYQIQQDRETIRDLKAQMAETKKNMEDPVFKAVRQTLQGTLAISEKNIDKVNSDIAVLQGKAAHVRQVMAAMPPRASAAPARLDYQRKSDEFGGLEQLVPAGSGEGVMLTKLNPGYYHKAANAPTAQLITVYYSWPTLGFAQDPDYLQRAVLSVFRGLDYHALKAAMP